MNKLRTENVAVKVVNLLISLSLALQPIAYSAEQITSSPTLVPTVDATSTQQTVQEQPAPQQTTDSNFLAETQTLSMSEPAEAPVEQADLSQVEAFLTLNELADRMNELGINTNAEDIFEIDNLCPADDCSVDPQASYVLVQGPDGKIAVNYFNRIHRPIYQWLSNGTRITVGISDGNIGEVVYFVPGQNPIRLKAEGITAPGFSGVGFNADGQLLVSTFGAGDMILNEDGTTQTINDIKFYIPEVNRTITTGKYGKPSVVESNDYYTVLGFPIHGVFYIAPKDEQVSMAGYEFILDSPNHPPTSEMAVVDAVFLQNREDEVVVKLTLKNGDTKYAVGKPITWSDGTRHLSLSSGDEIRSGVPVTVGAPGYDIMVDGYHVVATGGSIGGPYIRATIKIYDSQGTLVREGEFNPPINIQAVEGGVIKVTNTMFGSAFYLNLNLERVVYAQTLLGEPEQRAALYVTSASVAESRETVSDFMALLAQKGITQFTQAEVESLINSVPNYTFVGKFYLSVQGDQAAVMVSGEHHHFTCTVSGGINYCTMDGIVGPFTNVFYKPTPTSVGIRKDTLDSLGGTIAMGFTSDGLLVINYGNAQATAIDQQGQTRILADRVFVESTVQINSFAAAVNVNVITVSGKVSNFDPTKQNLRLSIPWEGIDIGSLVQPDGTFTFSFTRNAGTYSVYLNVTESSTNNPLQYAEVTGISVTQSTTIDSFSHVIANGNQITFSGQLANFNSQYQKLVFVFGSSVLTQTTTDITAIVLGNGSFTYTVTPEISSVYNATIKVVDRNTTVFEDLQTKSILNISVTAPPSITTFSQNVTNGNQLTLNGKVANYDPTKHKLMLSSSIGTVQVGVNADGSFIYNVTIPTPGFYDVTLSIVDRATNQALKQSTISNIAIVPPAVMAFYGGSLPAGAKIIDIQDGTGAGKWDITVELNQSTTSGEVRYQVVSLNTTGANVMRIVRVREVDYQSKLVRRSTFNYANNTATNWQTITRYNSSGQLVSTLRIVTQNGKTYYKLDYAAASKTDVILGETTTLSWFQLMSMALSLQG